MVAETATLALLRSVAGEYGATLRLEPEGAFASITLCPPGGSHHTFQLVLTINESGISVNELPGENKLPNFCPDRHINPDGSFCLGWGADDPRVVSDERTARRWWTSVNLFLTRQICASSRGVFPGSEYGRAHGYAALHQENAENAAAHLGPGFASNARAGRITVCKKGDPDKGHLELWSEGTLIARVAARAKALVGKHRLCPCGRLPPRPIADCEDHVSALSNFIIEQYECISAEQDLFDCLVYEGAECCGTLKNCGLRRTIEAKGSISE